VARVALTFDNGPYPEVTPRVLDTLARHSVPAAFFVVGERLEKHPDLAREALARGHRIGSHTWSHAALGPLAPAAAADEFARGADAVERFGFPEKLFRPVGGGNLGPHLLQPAVTDRLIARGYTCVLWNSAPGDWRDPHGWLARALADIRARPWTVLVLHDQPGGGMDRLDEFLTRVKAEGHTFTPDFPAECVPILEGRVALPLEPYSARTA
jgi:peptidoglycan/xylan/chitin deacetylase (PgdA/CDA1 family)